MRRRAPELRSSPRKRGPRAADRGVWIPACAGMSGIGRREFILAVGGAAAPVLLWPRAPRAQQPARLPTIGFLGANTPSAQRQWTAAFERRLRELGWIEGRNVTIEYRWAESRFERSPEII